MQIRTESGFAGLSVETVREAAKRAGVSLQWVETGTSSDEALQRGLVDLWPAMIDLPERRKRVHITRPWMHTSHTLVLRAEMEAPGSNFAGRIAFFKVPVDVRLARVEFPGAQLVEYADMREIVKAVCTGAVAAGFLEGRAALASMREKPYECTTTELRLYPLRNLTLPLGIGSTFEAAGAADRIRDEIGRLFRDGTLAATMAKYSYYGLDDTWATYDLMSAIERARWMAWVMSVVAVGLTLALWQTLWLRQRKRSERTLRESEERFRRVFEDGPLGLALVGRDYRFVKVNSALCQMVGYPEGELVQMSFIDITYPDDVRSNVELAEQLFKREIPFYRMRKRYVRKTGEIIWISLTASIILGPDGQPLHGLAMVEDITEIKRTQEEALFRQNLESVGTLAGGIAHDFNNLLGGVLAQSELALSELDAGSSCKEELKMIREVAIRGSEIVRQLMIYAGKESEVVERVDPSRIVEEMLALLKVSVSKHAVMKADLGQDLPATCAGAAQLRQIVMNLITNASDAIGDRDGVIRVSTRRTTIGGASATAPESLSDGDYVVLEVSDTGCGMSREAQERLFDPFFTTKSAGRGLGLAVVSGIVRSLGGAIRVTSELGKGSTFQVSLPCAETTFSAPSCAMPTIDELPDPSRQTAVLIVEDEDALRQAVAKTLGKNGFEVFEAADGSSAIDVLRAKQGKIDVILLDMTIPGASSREVVEEAANVKPDIRVVLTSAYSQEMFADAANIPQIRSFIRKPFQIGNLLRTLRSSLS
jgi:PAS domain S-box-containing protein